MSAPAAKQLEKLLKQRRDLALRSTYKARQGDTAAAQRMRDRVVEADREISRLMATEHNAANPPLPVVGDEGATGGVTDGARGRVRFRTGRRDR